MGKRSASTATILTPSLDYSPFGTQSSASLANCRCIRAPWLHWLIICVETTVRKTRRIRPHCWSLRLAPGSATWASSPSFVKLSIVAGLKPRSASCRPRLHDLRHGFAVNTILDGYRDGREPGNRIALLSTYLGHVDPVSTYWYLSAAPELLTLVGDRLERHLGGAA